MADRRGAPGGTATNADAVPAGEAMVLENAALRVTMWPRMGGKIVSMVVRRGGEEHELLHPPIHAYSVATDVSGFEASDAGGWDECLPSVAGCVLDGVAVPDHGDVWRRAWQGRKEGGAIDAQVNGFSMPLRFSRRISLEGAGLHFAYAVENVGAGDCSFLWSVHPLFTVEEGDRIVLPASVKTVRVQSSCAAGMVEDDGTESWPNASFSGSESIDLSRVGARDGATSYKLFAGPLSEGWCGLYRASLGMGVVMYFDPILLPYAGLWISQGAWPPGGGANAQYTVALEPTTADRDALDEAKKNGTAKVLPPGATFRWPLRLELIGGDAGVSFPDFCLKAETRPFFLHEAV